MCEEVVIRFNRESWEQNRLINIDDYCVDLGAFEDQEPALSKDWRPMCYDSQYNKLNGCDPGSIIANTCKQCPWLADRHRKKIIRKME